jgi:uncharacterized membrane protein YphA (DoxX/SURF4 family)
MSATTSSSSPSRKLNVTLWTVQVLLALLFIFAGSMKWLTPVSVLTQMSQMPGEFIRFIGACEFLGGLGLLLPGITRIRPVLTPLAATGLVIIMTGATIITGIRGQVAPTVMTAVFAGLLVFVADGRWRRAPHRERVARVVRTRLSHAAA